MYNIWSVQHVKPFDAFVEFYNPSSNRKPRIREFFDIVWKTYKVNQSQTKSIFHQVERIKVIEWGINKTMNLGELSAIQKNIAETKMRVIDSKHYKALNDVFFPLHDYSKLKGDDYINSFSTLLKNKRIYSNEDMIQIQEKKRVEKLDDDVHQLTTKGIKNYLINVVSERDARISNKIDNTESPQIMPPSSRKLINSLSIENGIESQRVIYDSNLDQGNGNKKNTENDYDDRLKEITELIQNANKDDILRDTNDLDISEMEEEVSKNNELNLLEENKAFKKKYINQKDNNQSIAGSTVKKKKKDPLKRYNKIKKSIYKFNKPIWPLDKIFIIYPFKPWKIAYKALIYYFGERLSLYFKFTAFYATMLIMIMFFALGVYIIDFISYYEDTDTNKAWRAANAILYLILSLVVICWANLFYWVWLKKERQFLIETGYENTLEEKPRVNFRKALIKRSLVDDFVNSKQANYAMVYFKLFIVILITIAFYCLSLGATIGLFYFKNYTVEQLPDENWAYINQNVANGIEILKIIILDEVFYWLAIRLIMWVDPKYMHEFDNYLITIVMLFSLMNNYFILILIIFIKSSADKFILCAEQKQELNNNTYKSYCVVEAEIFFKFYVIVKVIYNIVRLIWNGIYMRYKDFMIKKHEAKIDEINQNRNERTREIRTSIKTKSITKTVEKNLLTVEHFNYSDLNKIIEKQVFLDISNDSDDFDTTLKHYLELILSLTGLSWFGILYPLSFLLFYITIILELYIDKNRFFENLRRPSPLGKAALGLWDYVISLVAGLSVFTNSYIIAFLYTEDGIFGINEQDEKNILFIVLVIIGVLIGVLVAALSYKTPSQVVFLTERQNFIYNKIMANKITGMAMETETALIKANISPNGEVDYEFYDKEREKKKQKILEEANSF